MLINQMEYLFGRIDTFSHPTTQIVHSTLHSLNNTDAGLHDDHHQNNIWKFDTLGHPTKTHILKLKKKKFKSSKLLLILVYMINLF